MVKSYFLHYLERLPAENETESTYVSMISTSICLLTFFIGLDERVVMHVCGLPFEALYTSIFFKRDHVRTTLPFHAFLGLIAMFSSTLFQVIAYCDFHEQAAATVISATATPTTASDITTSPSPHHPQILSVSTAVSLHLGIVWLVRWVAG